MSNVYTVITPPPLIYASALDNIWILSKPSSSSNTCALLMLKGKCLIKMRSDVNTNYASYGVHSYTSTVRLLYCTQWIRKEAVSLSSLRYILNTSLIYAHTIIS